MIYRLPLPSIRRHRPARLRRSALWLLVGVLGVAAAGAPVPPTAAGAVAVTGSGVDSAESITLLHADADSVRLRVSLPVPAVVTTIDGRDRLALDGFSRVGRIGRPDLPQRRLWIAVPPGRRPVLTVTFHAPPTPLPAAPALLRDAADAPVTLGSAGWFPAAPVALGHATRLRDLHVVPLDLSPVQVQLADGRARFVGDFTVTVAFDGPAPAPPHPARAESGPFDQMLARRVVNYAAARGWAQAPTVDLPPPNPCLRGAGSDFRLTVRTTGLHAVTYGDLGLAAPPASSAVHVCHRDRLVAVTLDDGDDGTFGPGDRVIFFGEALKTRQTDRNVYWLTVDAALAPVRAAGVDSAESGPFADGYRETVRFERDEIYLEQFPLDDPDQQYDHWFYERIGYNSTLADTITESFSASAIVPGDVTVRAEVWGFDDDDHRLDVRLNGVSFAADDDAFEFDGTGKTDGPQQVEGVVSAESLLPGANTVSVTAVAADDPDEPHTILLNWLELDYTRAFAARDGRLLFTQATAGDWQYATSGIDQPLIYDVTDPAAVRRVTGAVDGTFGVAAADAVFPARYALSAPDALLRPDVVRDTPSAWRNDAHGADVIIITSPLFHHPDGPDPLDALVAQRSAAGMRVAVALVQDIFDEYSYGIYDTGALRLFLADGYARWTAPAPTYLLLAGDASHDHRNVLGQNTVVDASGALVSDANAVPVWLQSGVDTYLGEAAADNQYVTFLDDGYGLLPALLIGRLPAHTPAQMTAMVDKILAYEQAAGQPHWQSRHLFVTDNESSGTVPGNCIEDSATVGLPNTTFFSLVDAFIRHHVPATQLVSRLYFADPDCYTAATVQPWYVFGPDEMLSRFTATVDSGVGLVVYTGHAGVDQWGAEGEGFVRADFADLLANGGATPIMLPMACLEGQYHRQDIVGGAGVSEAFVRRAGGGAVASFAPTGLHVATAHDLLLTGFYAALFADGPVTLGEAVLGAKLNLPLSAGSFYAELHDTYMLLGDPALPVHVWQPTAQVRVPALLKP